MTDKNANPRRFRLLFQLIFWTIWISVSIILAILALGLGIQATGFPASPLPATVGITIFAVLIGLSVYFGRLIQRVFVSHNVKNIGLKIWNSISINFLIKFILILGAIYLVTLLSEHFFPATPFRPAPEAP